MQQYFPRALLRYFPAVLALFVLGIYALFVTLIYGIESSQTPFDNGCLTCGTICVAMCIWCLYKTATGDPGFLMRGYNREGIKKECRICQASKPDRTHHCSKCQRCVLNMDHHCVWTNNCIGIYNRKSFNLILFWGCMGMLCATSIAFYNLPQIYTPVVEMKYDTQFQYLRRLFTLIIIFSQILNALGLYYFFLKNLRLILKNTTTLDDMRPQHQSEFDLGWKYNFKFYFGKNPFYWGLPIGHPLGNGIDWDRKHSEDLIII